MGGYYKDILNKHIIKNFLNNFHYGPFNKYTHRRIFLNKYLIYLNLFFIIKSPSKNKLIFYIPWEYGKCFYCLYFVYIYNIF